MSHKIIVREKKETDNDQIENILNKNFEIGENFFLGYSPEREDPGNKDFSTQPPAN